MPMFAKIIFDFNGMPIFLGDKVICTKKASGAKGQNAQMCKAIVTRFTETKIEVMYVDNYSDGSKELLDYNGVKVLKHPANIAKYNWI